jgi:predicted nucleic acid-binding protein
MITAVDTSVLLDVFGADARFGVASREALRRCRQEGGLVACEVVWAEVAAAFEDVTRMGSAMDTLGIGFVSLGADAAACAGSTWRRYRAAGGPRERVMSDFLIAAHAGQEADRLLTRDRGFFRRWFAEVSVLDPTQADSAPERRGPENLV